MSKPYHTGICSSCLIKYCPNPKQKKNHPERGCSAWTRYQKFNLPFFADFLNQPKQYELF